MAAAADRNSSIVEIKSPLRNATSDSASVQLLVSEVLAAVAKEGDAAVARYAEKFDRSRLKRFEVSDEERATAVAALDPQTRADTEFAIANDDSLWMMTRYWTGCSLTLVRTTDGIAVKPHWCDDETSVLGGTYERVP